MHGPQMFQGQHVSTPYGPGVIKEIRYLEHNEAESNDVHSNSKIDKVIINPLNWKMAGGQLPTMYMNSRDVKPLYPIGCVVKTSFGKGIVVKIRTDGIYVVHLEDWVLANNAVPVLYLNQQSISLIIEENEPVRPQKTVSTSDEQIEKGKAIKTEATAAFKKGNFEEAKDKFLEVLHLMQQGSPYMSDEEKAKRLELMITCCNNISLCYLKLKSFNESFLYSANAFQIIAGLEAEGVGSKILVFLNNIGVTNDELFKRIKRKSLYYMGKSKLAVNDFDESVKYLTDYSSMLSSEETTSINEAKDLLKRAQIGKEKEKKKEKDLWSKAFKKNKEEITQSINPVNDDVSSPKPPSHSVSKSSLHESGKESDKNRHVKVADFPEEAENEEEEDQEEESEVVSTSASIVANTLIAVSAALIVGFVFFKARSFRK